MKKRNLKLHHKYIIFSIFMVFLLLILTLFISVIYYFSYFLPQKQNEVLTLEKQRIEQEKQLLLDTINKLNINEDELKSNSVVTPTESITSKVETLPQPKSNCDQNKINIFKDKALSMGYSLEEVTAFINMAESNNCKIPTYLLTSDIDSKLKIDDINNKLTEMQNCQRYGICY